MTTALQPLKSDINVTSFLDVLLVLIITFLAAASARKTMDAQLAKPCEAACEASGRSIVLEVLSDCSFLLNAQAVTGSQLARTLHATFDARPEKIPQVAGHGDASYQQVLSAMDVATAGGVRVIGIRRARAIRSGSRAV